VGFDRAAIVAAGFSAALTVWNMLRLAVLGGAHRMRRVAVAQTTAAAAYLAAVGVLLVADVRSLAWALTAAAGSAGILAGMTGVNLRRSGPARAEMVTGARRFGLPAMVGEAASLLVTRADFLVVGLLLGSIDVGLYAVAVSLAELLLVAPNGAAQVLLPRVAADNDTELTLAVIGATSAIGIAAAIVMTAGASWVVPAVFGDAFADAANVVPLLAGAAVALGAWKLVLADLAGRGDTSIRVQSSLLAMGLMIGLDFAVVPHWGIAGAGASSLIAYGVALVASARRWAVTTGVPARRALRLRSAWRRLRAEVSDG
jgi:O-antigen/teichoic acid export membrane protein